MSECFWQRGEADNRQSSTAHASASAFSFYTGAKIVDPDVIARLESNGTALMRHRAMTFCFSRDPTRMEYPTNIKVEE